MLDFVKFSLLTIRKVPKLVHYNGERIVEKRLLKGFFLREPKYKTTLIG